MLIKNIKKQKGKRRFLQKKKKRIGRKLKLILLMCIFIAGAFCYSKASTEDETEAYNPTLKLESEGWQVSNGQYEDCIFSQEDREMSVQIQDEKFTVFGERKNLLFQVTEEDEEEEPQIKSYGMEDFHQNETIEDIYESILEFCADEDKESTYKIQIEYTNNLGDKMAGDADALSVYGTLEEGMFQSKKMIIDKKNPEIKDYISLESILETDADDEGDNGGISEKETRYFDGEIKGEIEVDEKYLDNNAIEILAVPLNSRAKQEAKESKQADENGNIRIVEWTCDTKGIHNKISFTFLNEGEWKIVFRCADAAKNQGLALAEASEEEKNYIESSNFIIDTQLPELKVQYGGIEKIAEKESSLFYVNQDIEDGLAQIMSSENEIFLKKKNYIKIQITEENFCPEDVELLLCNLAYNQGGGAIAEVDRKKLAQDGWERNGDNEWSYLVENLQEGHYRIKIRYKDRAGNMMTAKEKSETKCCMQDDEYLSPVCTADWTKPVITTCIYEKDYVRVKGERAYFSDAPVITIKVAEENFNYSNFKIEDIMTYADGSSISKKGTGLSGVREEQIDSQIDGEQMKTSSQSDEENETEGSLYWKSYYEKGVRINETKVKAEYQANYTATFQVKDSAENSGEEVEKQFTYDSEPPEILYTGKDNESGDIIFKLRTGSGSENKLMTFRMYKYFRYFGNKKIKISATVHDKVSGVEKIKYSLVQQDEPEKIIKNGEKTRESQQENAGEDDLSEYSVNIISPQEDFKGYCRVKAEDFCKNSGSEVKSYGAISETENLHATESGIKIEFPKAAFTDENEKIKYYNSEIEVKADFYDNYSGLLKTELHGINGETEVKSVKTIDSEDSENIIYQSSRKISLSSEKFSKSCKNLPITVYGLLTDNAGNGDERIYSEYKAVVDNIKPEIDVKYDYYNEESSYYNRSRTATVTIKDWNFNLDSVKWEMQGSNQSYRISEWERKENISVCKIYFDTDGENYAVGLSAADYSGNWASWKDRASFTIDQTAPKITIEMDEKGKEDNRYYNSTRKIYFRIEEKNFDKDKVNYEIKASNGKKNIKVDAPTEYVTKGDVLYSKLVLKLDGKYKIGIRCTDLAGNKSEKVKLDEFIIDTVSPKIQILGVENNRTYTDKIMPEVFCTDKNLDLSTVKIVLQHGNGKKTDTEVYPYEEETGGESLHITWDDFPAKKKIDGMYKLYIKGIDLAGNQTEIDNELYFRVNRFGADFEIGEETAKKISVRYLKEEPDILLKERSVNFTKSKILILKDNENRTELEKNKQYTVREGFLTDKSSLYFGWYEKSYQIGKENFSQEGSYKVFIQSDAYESFDKRFRIIKSTDNEIKKKPVYFIVDKTPPAVNLGNLDKTNYKEKEHYFTVTVLDNYEFERMELTITDKNEGNTKNIKITPDDLGENHSFTQKLTESSGYQIIRYVAWDKAGNRIDSDMNGDTRTCLVTTEEEVHNFYRKRRYYTVGAVAAGIGAAVMIPVGIYIYRRRRNKKKNTDVAQKEL